MTAPEDPSADVSIAADAPPHEPPPAALRLVWWIVSGVRSLLLLRPRRPQWSVTATDVVIVTAAVAVLDVLLSIVLAGGEGEWNIAGLPSLLFPVSLSLLIGFACARVAQDAELRTALPALLLAMTIPLEVIAAVLDVAASRGVVADRTASLAGSLFYPFYPVWFVAAGTAIMRTVTGFSRKTAAGVVFILCLAVPLLLVPRQYVYLPPAEAEPQASLDEDTFYTQPDLLDDVLAGVGHGRPGVADLYFVGFAGDSSQDVFMRETLTVERLLKEEFDTIGRSVCLVNNVKTASAYPFASASSLARTLQRVGAAMNTNEDVLLLFLTSHGTEENRLDVVNGPLDLREISPHELAQMLRRSGIVWKIVVVSACYSGGFVDALKDEHSMIVTASDARSPSFGCSSDSDFTWFSKAYFEDGLRTTRSFTESFRVARQTVAAREKREGEQPSNPQMFVGKKMTEKLKELYRQVGH